MPFGKDLTGILPCFDRKICDYVRSIKKEDITRREAHHHPDFSLRVAEDAADMFETLASDIFRRITTAAAEGRKFVVVLPIGPTGQYELLANKLNAAGTDLSHCEFFFMDEYAWADGTTVAKGSPWSFEYTANGKLFSKIDEAIRPKPEHINFPGPENITSYDEMILEASNGKGAEVVYGGIGWSGHFAFWDPHLWDEFDGDVEAWKGAHASFVRLHPMTLLHNSLRAGGDWTSVLPCAYSIGPAIFLGAQYRSLWADAYLGRGISWQRFIARLATHGPAQPSVPSSFVQTLPGEVVFLGQVAENISAPRVSWE